jgi:hypothetical protein
VPAAVIKRPTTKQRVIPHGPNEANRSTIGASPQAAVPDSGDEPDANNQLDNGIGSGSEAPPFGDSACGACVALMGAVDCESSVLGILDIPPPGVLPERYSPVESQLLWNGSGAPLRGFQRFSPSSRWLGRFIGRGFAGPAQATRARTARSSRATTGQTCSGGTTCPVRPVARSNRGRARWCRP